MTNQDLTEKNRAIMEDFLNLFYGQYKIREAFEKHVAEDYIQHSLLADNGRENAIVSISKLWATMPEIEINVLRVLVDGNMAMCHLYGKDNPQHDGIVVVDIFRLENGKIVEHWDVLQQVERETINGNTQY